MKKVGILTFHKANNHGAVLQCYALQEVLKIIGYEVVVIDYRQSYIEACYSPLSTTILKQCILHPKALSNYIKKIFIRIKKNNSFNLFRKKYLTISSIPCSKHNVPQDIDVYIIGSDQLWGLHCTKNLDPVYFGDFNRKDSSKIVGYAISSNLKSIKSIDSKSLIKYTNNFDNLSFREQNIADAVFEKTGITARVDIDPTLLADVKLWEKLIDTKWKLRKYIVIYQVRGTKETQRKLIKKAEEQAKLLDCEVVNLSNPAYSPIDFVSALKYARRVITTSFHASVFSIIFERPLQAVKLEDGNDGRFVSILTAIGAEDMLVDINLKPEIKTCDYALIKMQLKVLQDKSLAYLSKL